MLAILNKKVSRFLSEGHERSIKTKKNILISFIVKGGNIIVGLVLIPMTINYVNPVQYGIWLTISSIVSWINFFDIGMALGLRNKLAKDIALNDFNEVNKLVSTTYAVLSSISLSIFLIFYFISSFFNWNNLLNIPTSSTYSIRILILIVLGSFCIQFVVKIITDVLNALQQTGKASIIMFLGQVVVLLVIFFLKENVPGNLNILVIVLSGIPLIVLTIASLYLYKTKLKAFSPNFKSIDFKSSKSILNQGAVFFIIQITALIFFQTDNIIIAKILGTEAVTTFNVSYKLFSSIIMVFTIIITPYWSAFTNAYVKNDFEWIKQSIKKMRKVWLILSLISLFLFLISKTIYKVWLSNSITIPVSLSFSMLLYVIVYMWQTLHVFLLNGIGKLKLQLIVNIFFALLNIPLAVILGKKFGLIGVISANTIEFIFMNIFFTVQCEKIMNKTANYIWNK